MKLVKSVLILLIIITISDCGTAQDNISKDAWAKVDSILKNIKPPVFADKDFNVLDYGAKPDGITKSRKAFNDAINECSLKGGGRVVVPKGTYYCDGPIVLKSNVNFFLEEGALVKYSINPNDYLPVVLTRWEGVECYNYSALIYAYEQENIAVTGKGILDGQASKTNWWAWKGRIDTGWEDGQHSQNDENSRPLLMNMNNEKVPVEKRIFGEGHYLRPNFVQPIKCKNVLIEGVTFINSPMWFLHPVLCQNVSILNVTTKSIGPNTDGCDPESCKDVLIKGCYFSNGDDCIAIKSGRNNDGRRVNVPSENFVIQDCKMKDGHGGVVVGSEITGGAKNIFAENCEMDSPNLDRAIRLKSNTCRGGVIENVYVRNITIGEVGEAIVKMNMKYDTLEVGERGFLPVIKNIMVENVTSKKSRYAFYFDGLDESKIQNITIKDCKFAGVENKSIIGNVENFNQIDVYINGEKQ